MMTMPPSAAAPAEVVDIARVGANVSHRVERAPRKMKTKRVIHLAVLMCAVATVSCLLAYRHGSNSGHQRINCVSNLKQIGLAFRMGRNDFNGQFTLTGNVAVPKIQADER